MSKDTHTHKFFGNSESKAISTKAHSEKVFDSYLRLHQTMSSFPVLRNIGGLYAEPIAKTIMRQCAGNVKEFMLPETC